MPFPITGQNYYSNLSCSSGFVLRTVKPVTDYEHKIHVVPLKHVLSVLDPGEYERVTDWAGQLLLVVHCYVCAACKISGTARNTPIAYKPIPDTDLAKEYNIFCH